MLASPPAALPLADTVQEAIGRRLERLSPVGRQVLEAAAVLSPNLEFKLLQETAGRSGLELADGLDELLNQQLLTNGKGHQFQHDLIQQVAYLGLSPWRRQLLHQRAAEALGDFHRGGTDQVAALIARHYEMAGDSQAALGYYHKAAIAALGLYAHDEANEAKSFLQTRETLEVARNPSLVLLLELDPILSVDGMLFRLDGRIVAADAAGDHQRFLVATQEGPDSEPLHVVLNWTAELE